MASGSTGSCPRVKASRWQCCVRSYVRVQCAAVQVAGFLSAGSPMNQNGDNEADVEFGWNAYFLYHLNSQLEMLLELKGERVFGGEERGHSSAVVAPGLKLTPTRDENLKIGVDVGLPISSDKRGEVEPFVLTICSRRSDQRADRTYPIHPSTVLGDEPTDLAIVFKATPCWASSRA